MNEKRLRLLAACALMACGAAACRKSPPPVPPEATMPQGMPSAPQDLTNLFDAKIHAEWEAIKNKDKKTLDAMLDENYVAVESDREGERFRAKVLGELDRSNVKDYTLSFLKVSPLGPDTVFVRYEVFMHFPPGSAQPYLKVLVGEIWRQKNGEWKAVHYQETAVK